MDRHRKPKQFDKNRGQSPRDGVDKNRGQSPRDGVKQPYARLEGAGMVAKGKWHRIASLGAQVHSRTIEIDLRHSERRHDDHQRNR